jgi:hypothetical protein
MTVGGIGALCIYKYFLKEDYKRDPPVLRALEWMSKNYSVRKNPGKSPGWAYLYFLYGLERCGILYGTERFGGAEWYPDGANQLLDIQKPGGDWNTDVLDTCFAILFLRRATAPLIYSEDRQAK